MLDNNGIPVPAGQANLGYTILGIDIAFFTCSTISVVLRVGTRLGITRNFGWDDAMIVVAQVRLHSLLSSPSPSRGELHSSLQLIVLASYRRGQGLCRRRSFQWSWAAYDGSKRGNISQLSLFQFHRLATGMKASKTVDAKGAEYQTDYARSRSDQDIHLPLSSSPYTIQ